MASKNFRKEVAKLKKEDLATAVKQMMDDEFKALSRKEYADVYALEHNRRSGDSDDTFARVAYSKNTQLLAKAKKKDLEDLYVAYMEIKDAAFSGPETDADPSLPHA